LNCIVFYFLDLQTDQCKYHPAEQIVKDEAQNETIIMGSTNWHIGLPSGILGIRHREG
jgi:hypothetical protein